MDGRTGWTMKFGTKIATLLATAMMMLLGSNLAWADSNNSIVAKSASEFAKDVGLEENAIAALEEHEKGLTPHYIQCGSIICDLSKNGCYRRMGEMEATIDLQQHFKCAPEKPKGGKNGMYETYYVPCTKHCFDSGYLWVDGDYITKSDSEGREYRLFIGEEATIQYGEENFRGCEVLPIKLYKHRKCFFCPMIGVIYSAIATVTDTSFSIMAPACATLLALGFAIWIAIQVLVQVSSLTKQDAPKFLGSLIKQSYKVVIVFVLLQTPNNLFHYIIRPVVGVGLTFGENMLTTDAAKAFVQQDKDEYGQYKRQAKGKPGGKYYDTSTYDKIEKFVVAVQQEIAFMQATGTSLLCVGSKVMIDLMKRNWKQNIGDGFMMIVQGAILAIFGFLISIAFVFYLVDGIIQLGVAGGLMPLLLATWPFKPTQKWLGTGANMILNTSFLFMFIGLVVSVCVGLISATLSQNSAKDAYQELLDCQNLSDYYKTNKDHCEKLKNQTNFGGLAQIADALNKQQVEELKRLTDISGMGFLILIFASIFGFKFIGQAPALASKFASGGMGKPIAPSLATITASAAKSAALATTKDARESIGNKFSYGVETIASLSGAGASKLYNFMRGKNKTSSTNDNGNSAAGSSSSNGGSNSVGAKGNTLSSGHSDSEKRNAGSSGSVDSRTGTSRSDASEDNVATDTSNKSGGAGNTADIKKQAQKAQQKPKNKHKNKAKNNSKSHRKANKKRKKWAKSHKKRK